MVLNEYVSQGEATQVCRLWSSLLRFQNARGVLVNRWFLPLRHLVSLSKGTMLSLALSLFLGVNSVLNFSPFITHLFLPLPKSAVILSLHQHPDFSAFRMDIRVG